MINIRFLYFFSLLTCQPCIREGNVTALWSRKTSFPQPVMKIKTSFVTRPGLWGESRGFRVDSTRFRFVSILGSSLFILSFCVLFLFNLGTSRVPYDWCLFQIYCHNVVAKQINISWKKNMRCKTLISVFIL